MICHFVEVGYDFLRLLLLKKENGGVDKKFGGVRNKNIAVR
jgi:hypothetical protein